MKVEFCFGHEHFVLIMGTELSSCAVSTRNVEFSFCARTVLFDHQHESIFASMKVRYSQKLQSVVEQKVLNYTHHKIYMLTMISFF